MRDLGAKAHTASALKPALPGVPAALLADPGRESWDSKDGWRRQRCLGLRSPPGHWIVWLPVFYPDPEISGTIY